MENDEKLIKELLDEKKKIEQQINDANFKGYPEVKELNGKKYIYLRNKQYDHLTSKYMCVYTEKDYQSLKDLSRSVKQLNFKLRSIKFKLAKLGINTNDLDPKIIVNIDFVKTNMKTIIYGQAIVEGVTATFMDTEEIIEKGSSENVNFNDTLTILNLKNAWQYILDEDRYREKIDIKHLCKIAEYVNDRQMNNPGEIRKTNVRIGGCAYIPPIPKKNVVINNIKDIMNKNSENKAKIGINLLCYLTKAQVFKNGNKRISLIFANLYLISNGLGYLSIPAEFDNEFKKHLINYYEDKNNDIKEFLLNKCFNKI